MLKEAAPGRDQRTGGDPQNVNGASLFQTGAGSSASSLTPDDILDILRWTDDEYTAVSHHSSGVRSAPRRPS